MPSVFIIVECRPAIAASLLIQSAGNLTETDIGDELECARGLFMMVVGDSVVPLQLGC